MAIGSLASASRAHAQATMIWTNGSANWNSTTAWQTNLFTTYSNYFDAVGTTNIQVFDNFCAATLANTNSIIITNCVGGTAVPPSTPDVAQFTNSANPSITVTGPTTVRSLEALSNAVVTIGAGASTLTVTDTLRIAQANFTTGMVYWAGGTLAATNGGPSQVQIGTGTNSFGVLVVTNGTLIYDQNSAHSSSDIGINMGGIQSAGKLVISGSGVVTNHIGGNATLSMNGGPSTGGSQLIITNGGKLFVDGATTLKSNSLVLVSGTGSLLSNSLNVGSSVVTIGANNTAGPGSLLIVSNGATVWSEGTISFGRGGSFNTGMVVGAGSRLISDTSGGLVIGITTPGGSSNALVVYDGGYLRSGGTFEIPDGAPCPNNSFLMGGIGAMSTGLVVHVKNNSGSLYSSIIVTNAVLTCSLMEIEGGPTNTLAVLSKGTLIFSNQFAVSATQTNVLTAESFSPGYGNSITVNAGTISAVSGSNVSQIVIGLSGESGAASLTITNGGKLLSEQVEFGSGSSYNTGVVAGVGTVWSNYTAGAAYAGSNTLVVGTGSTVSGSYNYLAVQNGASLVNNGDLLIGNSGSSTLNSVAFGGSGPPPVIINSGSLTVGGSSASSGNTLTISNASVSAGFVKVRPTNTLVFAAGTLSAEGMDTDPGANNSNEFVVGDGVDAAYYDMAPGGTGYHIFGSPGLVVTNGAYLRGSGTIAGTMTVLGTFVPGFANSVGSMLTSNSLSFGDFAVLDYDLGTLSDSVTVNGNLKLGGTLNITDAGGFGAGNYTLFTYVGSLNAGGTLTVGSTPNGSLTYTIDTNTTGSVILHVTGGSDPYTTWTAHYGLSGGNAVGTADPDGDGMSNTNEFLAGFNPMNSAAYLHIISIVKTGNDISVTYLGANGDNTWSPGIASRTNVLEFTTGTANGSYSTNNFASTGLTNILSGGTGVGMVTNMVDIGGATNKPSRYYRVRVLVP